MIIAGSYSKDRVKARISLKPFTVIGMENGPDADILMTGANVTGATEATSLEVKTKLNKNIISAIFFKDMILIHRIK